MRTFKQASLCLLLMAAGGSASADMWEPGTGIQVQYGFDHEVKGDSGNSMEGDLFGIALRHATSSETPVSAGITFRIGDADHDGDKTYASATADTREVNVNVAAGKVFYPHRGLELIPYVGIGVRQMTQDFDADTYPSNNDIVTGKRRHRHLYLPVGLYLGSSSPLDRPDFYVSAQYNHVLMGKAELRRGGAATMNSDDGHGIGFEAGFHFPSTASFNAYVGIFYEKWTIDAADRGASSLQAGTRVEGEPSTKQVVAGVTLGLQF